MTPEQQVVFDIIEKALFDLQDLPESVYNAVARKDVWTALQNQSYAREEHNVRGKTGETIA